jgi:hypothetical protein
MQAVVGALFPETPRRKWKGIAQVRALSDLPWELGAPREMYYGKLTVIPNIVSSSRDEPSYASPPQKKSRPKSTAALAAAKMAFSD